MHAPGSVRTLGLALALAACAHETRFALAPPVTRADDARPLAHAPAHSPDLNAPYSIDNSFVRPIAQTFRFETAHEALDVNALDEVPDSTWFNNRTPTPAEAAEGPCAGVAPVALPLTISSSKLGGATPGFFVRDATGRRYALKFDQYPHGQPEMNTASDAAVTRLYWTLGYNTSCNNVIFVPLDALQIGPHAYREDLMGRRRPLTVEYVQRQIAQHGYRVGELYRFGLSLFIRGEVLGPWAAEGRRTDDPNDTIPHQDRRELRGERLLAAWVNHWDARAPNSLDSFVPAPGGGYVLHYEFDVGDSLGTWSDDLPRSDHQGFTYSFHPSVVLADLVTFGAIRRPWDSRVHDPVVPFLGTNFDVAHFDPGEWVPALPSPRFAAATDQDMAWMARRIARISRAHLDAVLAAGRFSNPRVPARIAEILMGRRERLLDWSFARVSPLTDLAVRGDHTLCATDLGLTTGRADPDRTAFAATAWRASVEPQGPRTTLAVERGDARGELCTELPAHVADPRVPDDSAARYVVVEITRDAGPHRTRLRAHFYDLGPARGYVLVGIER